MKKIHTLALVVCATFCLNACACGAPRPRRVKWDWDPTPYVGVPEEASIYGPLEDQEISCHEPIFRTYTCFSAEDIKSLNFNIKRLGIRKVKLLYKSE